MAVRGGIRLAPIGADRKTHDMNPIVLIVPTVILIGGVLCFALLPLPLLVRLAILISDMFAAGVIGFVLTRRLS